MHTLTPPFQYITVFLLLLVLITVILWADTAISNEKPTLPENTISISFNIHEKQLFGTSRIVIPSGTPLTLYCGPLQVTGSILEPVGASTLTLVPTVDNKILVPASEKPQTVYVSWSLSVSPETGSDNLVSDNGITLAGFWHPIPDMDMLYSLQARIPEHFTGVTENDSMSSTPCRDAENLKNVSASFSHPVRSIHFVAGPYELQSKQLKNDITISTYFFKEDANLADDYLQKAAVYVERYQDLIGPYPYDRYNIVENRLPTGYGMPTFTLLGQAVVRLPFIKDTSLGHEILHSWFGNSIKLSDGSGNWSEGLTTYLADQLYAEDNGKGSEYRKNQLLRYASYVHSDNDMPLQDFVNAGDSQPMAKKVRAIGYDKGSMVFHMLRIKLGDEVFFKALNTFYMKNRYKRAGWEDIEDSFTVVSGVDLSDFFTQWLTRWDLPRFSINHIDISQVQGKSIISFTVKQKNVEPYALTIPVLIKTRTDEKREIVNIREKNAAVKITVNELPSSLVIDPDYDLMRALWTEEKPPVWSMFIGAESRKAVLASEEDSEIYAPLISYLKDIGCETLPFDEISNADLTQGSFLFLGQSPQSQGLFADPNHPDSGFTLDVRKNQLEPDETMVLVTSSSQEETALATRKLRHYGKYSYLHFQEGRMKEKSKKPSAQGIHVELFAEPEGIRVSDVQTFDDIIGELENSRVVYVGEMHTDMGNHILQLQIIQALYQQDPNLAIGLEMFPKSSQDALDGYINGTIETEREFLKESNYFSVWGYDYRYYQELIGYARLHGIPLVALNIDKAIVSQIFQDGNLNTLDEDQIERIPAKRNLDVPGYRGRLIKAFSAHDSKRFSKEKLAGFLQAQSIWDETMADSIVDYLNKNPDKRMVVIAGTGHVYKDTAIPLRVKRRLDVSQKVVSSISYGTTGLETGYQVDYLLYTRNIDLEPAPKVGVVLKTEKVDKDSDQTRLRIMQISPHGKAGESNLNKKDIILALDNREVSDINDLKIGLLNKKPGNKVVLKILREKVLFSDEELEIEVELSSPMSMGGMPLSHPK